MHRFEVALHAVNADGDGIEEGEGFGMFGENGGEVTLEGHIGANEDAILSAAEIYAQDFLQAPAESTGSVVFLLINLRVGRKKT